MSEKITFKELVDLIASQSNQSRNSTNSFIHELVSIIENGLKSSGSVSISGFGKFELRWMKPRTGVNPQTGEELSIPGQNKVVFKPYKNLREDVNKPYAHLESRVVGETGKSDGSSNDTSESKSQSDSDAEDPFESILNDSDWNAAFSDSEETSETVDTKEPNAAYRSVSSASVSVDELLIERDNPRYSAEKESTQKAAAPAVKSESKKPSAIPNQEKIATEVQKSGSFKWSYAAAAIIALLAFIILFFMIQRFQSGDSTTQQNQIEVIDPAPNNAADNDPAIADNSEPDPPDPGSQTEFETSTLSVQPGQSLWTIAESELGNPYLWPVLYNLNQDLIDNPNQLPQASDILIPDISDPENLNEFEREQVALGYFSLYEWNRANNPEEARFFLWAVGVFSPDLLDQPPADVDPDDLEFARNR